MQRTADFHLMCARDCAAPPVHGPGYPCCHRITLPNSDYVHYVNWGTPSTTPGLLYCLNLENTCAAFEWKIFSLSSAASHVMFSIFGRTSSYHLPVRGSVLEPAPGRSVPKRQRSGPQMRNSSFKDSML